MPRLCPYDVSTVFKISNKGHPYPFVRPLHLLLGAALLGLFVIVDRQAASNLISSSLHVVVVGPSSLL